MGLRRWSVLLALAAVFWMHGVQCLAGDVGASAAATDVATSGHPAAGHAPPGDAAPAVDARPGAGVHEPAVVDVPTTPPHDGAHDGLPSHLGSACLAVLSVALAALTAVLLGVPVASQILPPGSRRPPRWSSVPGVRPPPDLFALCVQRT